MLYNTLLITLIYLTVSKANLYEGFQAEPFTDGMTFHVIYNIVEYQYFQINILEPVLEIWKQSLRPRNRDKANLLIPRLCDGQENGLEEGKRVCSNKCRKHIVCGSSLIPDELFDACFTKTGDQLTEQYAKGAGVAKDYVLFVSFDYTEDCVNREASAKVCFFDLYKFRPIAGQIRLCSAMLTQNENKQSFYQTVVAHEIGHLLGFNEELYGYYRYRNGTFRTKEASQYVQYKYRWPKANENTITKFNSTQMVADQLYEVETSVITLPAVVDVARKYFDCSELVGVPLENQDLTNKMNRAHFETRILAEELMSAVPRSRMGLTNFTLSLLLETGWYDVSYAKAKTMTWGKKAGCDFVTKNCYTYMMAKRNANHSIMPFCDWINIKTPACMPDRSGFGFCQLQLIETNLGYLTSLPKNKYSQKLKNINVGGIHQYEDYCPSITSDPDPRAWNRITQNCKTDLTIIPEGIKNPAMESFGPDSICIEHRQKGEQGETNSFEEFGASCHQHRCLNGIGLQLLFGSAWINCPLNGGIAEVNVRQDVSNLAGEIFCPACSDFCEETLCQLT